MPNRLAQSTSPYLLQHAHNPVQWWPWGEEAFEEARKRDVPILLSIGYSTCYWCHVMERESFENAEIGALLSERFVCIKVDREERPDVDDLYMQATLAVRGQGGWPMTVFLEPKHLRPFWCGTYLPPDRREQMPGITQIALGIETAWKGQRADVDRQASEIAGAVAEQLRGGPDPKPVGVRHVSDAVSMLLRMYDRQHGGFGRAPKFPQPVFLDFLLDVRSHVGSDETAQAVDVAVRHTLDRMAVGGLFDQVGGGFHRYSVDGHWTVPHFEKMLYDNAMLASVYAKAASWYGDEFYTKIAVRTLDYMLRKMRVDGVGGSEGPHAVGFASAQDAEVDHREGLNYLWTKDQLTALRGRLGEDATLAGDVYGVSRGPNFQDPHHPGDKPANVLRLDDRPDRLALAFGMTPEILGLRLARINEILYEERTKRDQPHRDDKVLAGWNGLAMSAMARGYTLTKDPRYLEAGLRAASFVTAQMMTMGGELLRSWRSGKTSGPGFFEDYAFVVRGLLDLAATGDLTAAKLAPAAAILAQKAADLFSDPVTGVYYDTRDNQADLFVRARSTHDGAIPSATGVHLHNLLDLSKATGEAAYTREAANVLASVSGQIAESPVGAINSVRALLRILTDEHARREAHGIISVAMDEHTEPAEVSGEQVVEIYSGVERVEAGPGRPGMFEIMVKIADGYHIVAAQPGEGWDGVLKPFRVFAMNADGGEACIEAYADYPDGELEGGETGARPVRVYRGAFTMKVVVEAEKPWKGRPLLGVEYQACSNSACLKPTRVELDVAVDRAV